MANSNVKVKPMLAATAEAEEGQAPKVSFPILVSPKLDGIRALRMNGQLVSRTLKPIPSPRAQEITAHLPDGVDGELIVGRPNHDPYRRTVSAVMTENDNTLDSMVPTGMLGGFHVKDVKTGVEFDVSSSTIPVIERPALWRQRKSLEGRILVYKYFPTGSKDRPRFPIFKGWRSKEDISA